MLIKTSFSCSRLAGTKFCLKPFALYINWVADSRKHWVSNIRTGWGLTDLFQQNVIGDTSSICLTPDFEDSLYNRIHNLFVRIALIFPFFSLFKQGYIRQLFLLSNWPSDFDMLMKSTYCQTPQPLGYLPQFYLFQLLLCHFYHPLAAALIGLPTSSQTRFTLSFYLKFVFHLIHMCLENT